MKQAKRNLPYPCDLIAGTGGYFLSVGLCLCMQDDFIEHWFQSLGIIAIQAVFAVNVIFAGLAMRRRPSWKLTVFAAWQTGTIFFLMLVEFKYLVIPVRVGGVILGVGFFIMVVAALMGLCWKIATSIHGLYRGWRIVSKP